jgi:chondroitin 4-sulfotransferase 11
MISSKHKLIFIHIPKTGGSSIHQMFDYSVSRPYIDKFDRERDHFTALDYKEHVPDYNDYFKFAFVRNPWDKLVSEYLFFKFGTDLWKPPHRIIDPKNLSFKEFIVNIQGINLDKHTHYSKSHYIPQTNYILDENLDICVDFIGRFEHFPRDLQVVYNKINIPLPGIPHKNKTKHRHYAEYYDDETRELAAKKYARDIEYFGYEFGE